MVNYGHRCSDGVFCHMGLADNGNDAENPECHTPIELLAANVWCYAVGLRDRSGEVLVASSSAHVDVCYNDSSSHAGLWYTLHELGATCLRNVSSIEVILRKIITVHQQMIRTAFRVTFKSPSITNLPTKNLSEYWYLIRTPPERIRLTRSSTC